jgi:hypothetical protein
MASAKFQFDAMAELIRYQKQAITQLRGKLAEQRDVMRSVREELVKANEYNNFVIT